MKMLAAVFAATVPMPAALAQDGSHIYGAPPSWNDYRQIAEAEIASRMIDPESARISWVTGYAKGWTKPFLGMRVDGYIACGGVNAKNRMGGYTGTSWFMVIVDYDRVLSLTIDKGEGSAAGDCRKMMREGRLPPVPQAAAITATTPSGAGDRASGQIGTTATGLTLQAMPDGAYVGAVRAGSPAAVADLRPGMVIASVNAIPLANMGEAMLKVVEAAGPTADLVIVGGRTVKLGKKP